MKKFISGIVATFLMLTPPISVQAETPNQRYFALPCDISSINGALFEITLNPTSTSTRIGDTDYSQNPGFECAGPSAFDISSGYAYWVSWTDPSNLVKVDPETGEQTVVGEFNISGQPPVNDIRSLTVDDEGNIYVVDNTGDVFQVNSLTAEMSLKADSATFESVYGFAYDPLEDDIHYWSNEGRELFKFDPVAGTLTLVTSGNKYDMFENYRDIENMYELDFDQYGNAYIMNYDLTIINSVTKERTVVSGSDINLNGTYAYSESFFVMPTTPPEPDNLFVTKRFYGLTKTGWSEKSKASFARFAENNSFNEVVCSVRMKRNPNMSFSENLKIAQKLGRSACRIATTENPDIEITVKAYVVKEKPMNSVKIRLRLNLR